MLYATRQDIEDLYGVDYLATLLPRDADPDVSTAAALTSASELVDGYVSVRYTLPLPSIPGTLRDAAIDIACYRLAVSHDRLSDEITNRNKMARSFLTDISAGRAKLGLAEPKIDAGTPSNGYSAPEGAEFSARKRQFGRGCE